MDFRAVRGVIGRLVPRGLRHPRVLIRWGTLRRTYLARDRRRRLGTPVVRYYAQQFLERQAGEPGYVSGVIRGRVLDVGEEGFASWLGMEGSEITRVMTLSEVTRGDGYDCVLIGSALAESLDLQKAAGMISGLLRPGGVALAMLPGICPARDSADRRWGFTPLAARRLFEVAFPATEVTTEAFGNVLSSAAHLHGVPARYLKAGELDLHDPDYPLLVTVKASQDARGGSASSPDVRPPVRRQGRRTFSPVSLGAVRFGSFRSPTPFSRRFGEDRGRAVDRGYIEGFLARHQEDVRGRVLEFGQPTYTRLFQSRGLQIDIADPDPQHPAATVTLDLAGGEPSQVGTYECIICAQVLLLLFDVPGALRRLHALLAPGGVLLLTVPAASQICRPDFDLWGDYWRFSRRLVEDLLAEVFDEVRVEPGGNLLSTTAFLYGLADHELSRVDCEFDDLDHPLIITARAVKAAA